jgi:hypothetical protein
MKSPIPVRFYHEANPPNALEPQPPLAIIIVPDGESQYSLAYWVNNEGKAKQIRSRQARWSKAINHEILFVDGRFFLTIELVSVRLPLMLDGEELILRPYHDLSWTNVSHINFIPSAGWTIEQLPIDGNCTLRIIADERNHLYRVIKECSQMAGSTPSPSFDDMSVFTFDDGDISMDAG